MINSVNNAKVQIREINPSVKSNQSVATPQSNNISNSVDNLSQKSGLSLKPNISQAPSFDINAMNFKLAKTDNSSGAAKTENLTDYPTADHPVISAYFSKVQSTFDPANNGISAESKFPEIIFDESRFTSRGVDQKSGLPTGGIALDIPSVYVGGNSNDKELDCGVSWDQVYEKNKKVKPTYTIFPNVTDGNKPEMRFSSIMVPGQNKDDEGKVIDEVVAWRDGNGTLVAGNDPSKPDEKPQKMCSAKEFSSELQPNYAFRPFWRTTNDESQQLKIEERDPATYDEKTKKILLENKKSYDLQKINDSSYQYFTDRRGKAVIKDNKVAIVGDPSKKEYDLKKDGTKYYYETANNKRYIIDRHPISKEGSNFYAAKPTWHNPPVNSDNNVYFYPGQKANMDLGVASNGKATLRINIHNKDKKKDIEFKQSFEVAGFNANSPKSFKIVNSIDQFDFKDGKKAGLEGQKSGVLPTTTTALDGEWNQVKIKKVTGDESLDLAKTNKTRGNDTLEDDFELSKSSEGGVNIDITPDTKDHQDIRSVANKAKEEINKLVTDPAFKQKMANMYSDLNKLMTPKPANKKEQETTQRNLIRQEVKSIVSKHLTDLDSLSSDKKLIREQKKAIIDEMFIYLKMKSQEEV